MFDIPTIKVTESKKKKGYVVFWCEFCNKFHYHGNKALGHRVAHCINENSPYYSSGYILEE